MMKLVIRKERKEYEFWGIRSFSTEKGYVLLFIDSIAAECRGITGGKVVSGFATNLDYSHTEEESKAITW